MNWFAYGVLAVIAIAQWWMTGHGFMLAARVFDDHEARLKVLEGKKEEK